MSRFYLITISVAFAAIIFFIVSLKDNDDLTSILNQQIGSNIERSELDEMLGTPVGEFVRGDILELHYEFKVMKPEVYQRFKFVGVILKVKNGKVVSWDKMY